jgi:hypothetical protein
MPFAATVAKASELFEFAEDQLIADYYHIQDLIEGDPEEHFMWNKSCFTVTHDSISEWDWAPQVEEMVNRFMWNYDIELLVIVTDDDAHLDQYPRRDL